MAMIQADNYSAFRRASRNGHLDIIKWHKEQMPYELRAMIEAKSYSAFSYAASNGHLHILKWIKEEAPNEWLAMIQAGCYYRYGRDFLERNISFKWENNQLETLKWLKEQAPNEWKAIIKSNNYYPFYRASEDGHLETLKWLKEHTPYYDWMDMIKKDVDVYYAFSKASENGHLDILKWLKEHVWYFTNIIKSKDYSAFITAFNRATHKRFSTKSHLDTVNWLLLTPTCFAHAEQNVKYKEVVNPFIEETLASLHQKSETFKILNPKRVYDIKEYESSQLCFYILRNLIRRNDPSYDEELRFLLNIPSVKALAHEITSDNSNELFKLALLMGNETAINLLLKSDAVRGIAPQSKRDNTKIQIRKLLDSPDLFPQKPSERVKFAMAFANLLLGSSTEAPSEACKLKVEAGHIKRARYIWTALMVFGKNLPNMWFDHRALDISGRWPDGYGDYGDKFKAEKELGGYWSTFSSNSLHETVFKHYLTKDMLLLSDNPELFEGISNKLHKSVVGQIKAQEQRIPEELKKREAKKLQIYELLNTPLFFPEEPSARVKFAMAFANFSLGDIECPSEEYPFSLRRFYDKEEFCKYLWTAYLVFGINHPKYPFDHKSIDASFPFKSKELGGYWSTFSSTSLYETIFKHHLTKDMLVLTENPEFFVGISSQKYKTVGEQIEAKKQVIKDPLWEETRRMEEARKKIDEARLLQEAKKIEEERGIQEAQRLEKAKKTEEREKTFDSLLNSTNPTASDFLDLGLSY
ncbi:MAG: hypothetical protein H0U73_00685, partial [Tatlockia sp.]|nr:hypothetical protein [Tatlockia sp.]